MARPKATIEPSRLVSAFAAHGVTGITSDQLAELARVAKPTLYAHGHTKETLFLLAVEIEVERLLDRLYRAERLTRGRSARDRATGAAHAILNHGAVRPDGLRLIVRAAHERTVAGGDDATAAVSRVPDRLTVALRRDLSADGLDATLAPLLARALWGATLALAVGPTGENRPKRERIAGLAASLIPPPPSLPPKQWPPAT